MVQRLVDMTLPGILAYKSILAGNMPFDVPDFRDKATREGCRGDLFSVDPAVSGKAAAPNCSFGVPKIPASVYARQRRLYEKTLAPR